MRKSIIGTWGLVILLTFSCKKETSIHAIDGQLYENCSTVFSSGEVALKSNADAVGSKPLILGSAITESDGSFQFTYELEENEEGTADLILIQSAGYQTLISNLPLRRDLSLKLFQENVANLKIELTGNRQFAATDTLFYGLQLGSLESSRIAPINGPVDTLSLSIANTLNRKTGTTFYYGIGEAEFKLSKEALALPDSTYNHINLELNGCHAADQLLLEIN